jgi:S1-C subfamily serine protease
MAAVAPVLVAGAGGGRLRLGLGPAPPGSGLFDGSSRLVAVAGRDGAAWTARAAVDHLQRRSPPVPVSLGLTLQSITPELALLLPSPAGALVADVRPGSAGDEAGIAPGDVLVNIGARPVASPDEARQALAAAGPGAATTVMVRRAGGEQTLAATIRGACAPHPAGAVAEGVTAATVFEAEALTRAGLPKDAVVLSVGGRPPTDARRRKPAYLVRAAPPGAPPAFFVVRP